MDNLPGYRISELIYENDRTISYRGYSDKCGAPVIIKTLKKDMVNHFEISRLVNEFKITSNLDIDGVIKAVKMEQHDNFTAIIMENAEGISLREYMKKCHLSLDAFFKIAINLAGTLSHLHQKGIVHRNLRPENILVHPQTHKTHIIDFLTRFF